MKLNIKLFFVAALGFAAGFVACLVFGLAMSREQTSPPIVTTGSAVAFTQVQPKMIVLPPSHRTPLQSRSQNTFNFVPDIELMPSRSLDLIDMRDRYQPKMDVEQTDK